MQYLCSGNKGAEQLRGYPEADLRLDFAYAKSRYSHNEAQLSSYGEIEIPCMCELLWPLALTTRHLNSCLQYLVACSLNDYVEIPTVSLSAFAKISTRLWTDDPRCEKTSLHGF